MLRNDRVFPHQLIRDYCPAIINFVDDDRTKCTRLLALQVAAIGDFKAIVKLFLAFLLYGASAMSMSLQVQLLDDDCDQSACTMGRDAMQLVDHVYC